jgi:putative transposase
VAEVSPLLYLHRPVQLGLGTGGGAIPGVRPGLCHHHPAYQRWQDARAFNSRSLAGTNYVDVWVDGIHLKVRLEADKVCRWRP